MGKKTLLNKPKVIASNVRLQVPPGKLGLVVVSGNLEVLCIVLLLVTARFVVVLCVVGLRRGVSLTV